MQSYVLYLHGFNSSPQSYKAQVVRHWLQRHHPHLRVEIPALAVSPREAVEQLEANYFADNKVRPIGIIGSSLGGYYALHLSVRHTVPAALVNPAIYPYRLLKDYLGINRNLYTGEVYELGPSHMAELLALETEPPAYPQQVLTLLQTGDQTLDYREAVQKFHYHPLWVQGGGSHEFEGFEQTLPAIVAFFQRFAENRAGD